MDADRWSLAIRQRSLSSGAIPSKYSAATKLASSLGARVWRLASDCCSGALTTSGIPSRRSISVRITWSTEESLCRTTTLQRSYAMSVEGTRPVDVAIHFQPVLDLYVASGSWRPVHAWIESAPGYQISEPGYGNSAVVGSAETVAHDDTLNSTVRSESGLSFTVRPLATAHPCRERYSVRRAKRYSRERSRGSAA